MNDDIYTTTEAIEFDVTEQYKYEGTRSQQYYITPWHLLDNLSFLNWMGTTENKIWCKMYRRTIRGHMKSKLGNYIYENFYKNGIVAMAWKQSEITKELGLKSRGHISEIIKSMIKKGVIKRHYITWFGRKISIYEFGTHDMGPNRHETLHLHIHFTKLEASIKLKGIFS
jgi:ribosomal protein L30/L7E